MKAISVLRRPINPTQHILAAVTRSIFPPGFGRRSQPRTRGYPIIQSPPSKPRRHSRIAPGLMLPLLLATATAYLAIAAASPSQTNLWGEPSHGATMSISNADTSSVLTPANPPNLTIRIRNVSDQNVALVRTADPTVDFSFDVTYPSGKRITTTKQQYDGVSHRTFHTILPNQTSAFGQVDLRSACALSDPGTYTVVLSRIILSAVGSTNTQPYEIRSNPLTFTLTNAPTRTGKQQTPDTSQKGF